MILDEFYRHRMTKLNDEIKDAESKRDFNKMAKLESKKSEIEKEIKAQWKER